MLLIPQWLIIFLSCPKMYKPTMDPSLIEFFGDLDLGMQGRYICEIEPGMNYSGEDDSYWGDSFNNPIVNIDTFVPAYLPIYPFDQYARITRLSARIKDDKIQIWRQTNQSEKLSCEYWISYFTTELESEPTHYINTNFEFSKITDIYVWEHAYYAFEIAKYKKATDDDLIGFVFLASNDEGYKYWNDGNYCKITASGDTVEVIPLNNK